MAIVAPTGVAAINAGGVTIHSFFQLPFAPYIPGSQAGAQRQIRFSTEKINLIKSLDLLVIDEISMVRADTLDSIDEVLRRYRDRFKPFGGVQLLMIGDLHQLSPVIKEEEWAMLRPYYDTIFFFSSNALKKTNPVRIELTHIYRQTDTFFIDLLNRVRSNQLDQATLDALNQRYIPDFKPADDEGYITLTTHNQTAQGINSQKLEELSSPTVTFGAIIEGDFPSYAYPTEVDLSLKVGAQVMFVKNDSSKDKLYYNGKIGQVSNIDEEHIYVKCEGEYLEIEVQQAEWQNIRYVLNPETKEVEEQVIGSFRQYPLKLAWAITIHKSQGLTFEKAIIDANASFAHGQVYVALSRCKSFEGMVLRSPIASRSVKTDGTVAAYSKETRESSPDEESLMDSKIEYQRALLNELFDFAEVKRTLFAFNRVMEEHSATVNAAALERSRQLMLAGNAEIFQVADKFRNQLNQIWGERTLPELDEAVQERVQKACGYFLNKLTESLLPPGETLEVESDNKAVRKTALQSLESFLRTLSIKRACLVASIPVFRTDRYIRARVDADIDFITKDKVPGTPKASRTPEDVPHGTLYVALKAWRNAIAAEYNVPVYMVLPQKSLQELVNKLPVSLQELEGVKGMGKTKVKQYGKEIVELIAAYCEEHGVERPEITLPLKTEKPDTKRISLELFLSGKTMEEVAVERGLATGTIETHLIHFIGTGELDIYSVFRKENIDQIMSFLDENRMQSLTELKQALGDDISYSEIKAVQRYLRAED